MHERRENDEEEQKQGRKAAAAEDQKAPRISIDKQRADNAADGERHHYARRRKLSEIAEKNLRS